MSVSLGRIWFCPRPLPHLLSPLHSPGVTRPGRAVFQQVCARVRCAPLPSSCTALEPNSAYYEAKRADNTYKFVHVTHLCHLSAPRSRPRTRPFPMLVQNVFVPTLCSNSHPNKRVLPLFPPYLPQLCPGSQPAKRSLGPSAGGADVPACPWGLLSHPPSLPLHRDLCCDQ